MVELIGWRPLEDSICQTRLPHTPSGLRWTLHALTARTAKSLTDRMAGSARHAVWTARQRVNRNRRREEAFRAAKRVSSLCARQARAARCRGPLRYYLCDTVDLWVIVHPAPNSDLSPNRNRIAETLNVGIDHTILNRHGQDRHASDHSNNRSHNDRFLGDCVDVQRNRQEHRGCLSVQACCSVISMASASSDH